MEEVEKVFCGRMDHGGCGLLVQVEDGKIVKINGDPDSFTRGYICPKGRAHAERIYHPDRLLHPQKRIGAKGENRWQRISWDEAFETITGRFSECKNHLGAEKALFMQGTPKGLENLLLYRFAHSLGSPNVAATGTVCFAPRVGAGLVTNGFYPHPDIEHPPELILVWGSNHLSTNADGVIAPKVSLALKKGSRILLIDPAKRELAAKADVWLRIKPGTDGLLALGMIKVMIEEGLCDQEFVEKWCVGFDKLKAHVASYSLTDIDNKTWIPRKDIEGAARLYAEAKSGCILWGNATDHNINSVQTARALLILMALSGNLDRPGGNIQAGMPGLVRTSEFMLMPKFHTMKDKMIGKDFKLSAMLGFIPYHLAIKAVHDEKPYEINTVYIQGTNPLMSYPNAQYTFQALKKANFLVVADLFMTPTAQLADIVLPVASHFEFNDLGYYGLPFGKVLARPKIVDPPGECVSDIKIINELAMRLGLEDPFWDDEKACIDFVLKPSGLSFQDLKKQGLIEGEKRYEKFLEKGFRTKSGKVELYATWMETNGYAPLPVFSEINQDDDKKGELILTSGKINVFFHSMNRNLPSLRKGHPDPIVVIHPETAKHFSIDEGEWVWVENGEGRAKFKAVFQSEVNPRIVIVEHAWWFPEKDPLGFYDWKGSNINVLTKTDPPYEPAIGTMNLRGISCRVYKA
jgi:anaerobic selenocysteine-containing dehydrogenase